MKKQNFSGCQRKYEEVINEYLDSIITQEDVEECAIEVVKDQINKLEFVSSSNKLSGKCTYLWFD